MLDAFVFWPNNSVGDISTRPLLPSSPDSMVISYLIWYLCIGVGFLFQLYDSFLSFYYSSLTFKLSNKTALMKYSTRYSLRKGRLIIQVSDKSADCFSLNGFAMSIVGIFQPEDSKYDTSVGCLDIFYWPVTVFNCMMTESYEICANIIQFHHHEDGFVSIQVENFL